MSTEPHDPTVDVIADVLWDALNSIREEHFPDEPSARAWCVKWAETIVQEVEQLGPTGW